MKCKKEPAATTLRGNPMTLLGPELKAGDKAPDFDVVNDSLKPVNLESTGKHVRIFSVVPSLDTPVCDAQTKRFNEEAAKLPNVDIYTISMDLPFAQKRWCGNLAWIRSKCCRITRPVRSASHYGTLIKELRIESRAIFVIGEDNTLRYVEYVKEVADHPNYDAALAAAKQ